MANYNILVSDVPVSGTALARITTTENGQPVDVASVRAVWKDHAGATIADMTRVASDIATTGVHGEAATLADVSGTGVYETTLVVDSGAYSAISLPATFSLTVTVVDSQGSYTKVFTFDVVSSSLNVVLDTVAVNTAVRRLAGLSEEVTHLAEGDEPDRQNLVSLGASIVYGIDTATKNGVPMALGVDYSWVTHRPNVKLLADPAANDFFHFVIKTGMSDASLEEHILAAQRRVVSALAEFYDDDAIATYPTTLGIIQDIAVGEIRQLTARGVALESAHYRSGRDLQKEAMERLRRIKNGTDAVVDWAGLVVERRGHALVGGFRNANGAIAQRAHWWTRLQDYQASIVRPVGQTEA